MKKVAVVGGGIFGVTAAIYAARAGHEVHLFEKKQGLLQAASGINQYRLHRGYHYPRSPETARSAKGADASFRAEYGEAVITSGRHLYAIANKGSLVSPDEFLSFCSSQGLSVTKTESGLLNHTEVSLEIEGEESWIDPEILRILATQKLEKAGVHVHLGVRADRKTYKTHDVVILATYARLNELLPEEVTAPAYQYEVCEKPVVRVPTLRNTGIVVLDGPFMCVDPWGESGFHVLGNVVHAIHATNIGPAPEVPDHLAPLLDRGLVKDPLVTKIQEFIESGSTYIPSLKNAEHIGSLYTIRTVLPRLEKTDARPTIVSTVSDTCIRIFSGKIGNCVEAAKEVVTLL